MAKGLPKYLKLDKYNISPDDVVELPLRCKPNDIQKNVIITPVWEAKIFQAYVDNIVPVVDGSVYDFIINDKAITFIRSGIGAPQSGDVVLALGCTQCSNLIFTGSVGGLRNDLTIGDLVLVTESIGGDGFSSYLLEEGLSSAALLKEAKPDSELTNLLEYHAVTSCQDRDVGFSKGIVYSTDTIIAQFFHLDSIVKKFSCIGIEMETSAVFNSAALVGIHAGALLQISDVIPINKSLFSGRAEQDRSRRSEIRSSLLSKILLDVFNYDGKSVD